MQMVRDLVWLGAFGYDDGRVFCGHGYCRAGQWQGCGDDGFTASGPVEIVINDAAKLGKKVTDPLKTVLLAGQPLLRGCGPVAR